MFSSRRSQLRRAGDRDDPGLLGQQPGEGDLGWRRASSARAMLPSKSTNAWFALRASGVKRGTRAAEVGAVERRALVDLARQKTLAQRAVRHEADAEFLEGRDDLLSRASATRANTRFAARRPAGPRARGGSSAPPLRRGRNA